MTIKEVIDFASKKIGYIEANILMEYVLNVNKNYLIINSKQELNANDEEKYVMYLKEIEEGYPIQYITKKQEFMGLEFEVNEDVLIPRPDTECLVEEAIKKINILLENKDKIKILDLCTGSGAIAISVAKNIKNADIYATDISDKALKIAKKNYKNIIKKENATISFIQSDMFENIEGKFDVIISNPPYIKKSIITTLDKNVQNEPHIALDGGEDGLKFYKIIKNNINKYLKNDGVLLLEIGYDQKKELLELFEGAICIKDLAGNDRVIIWYKH